MVTDQAQRTAWAVQKFDEFVGIFVAPFIQSQVQASIESVRLAICAIAPPVASKPVVGYAVFAQRPDRERDCGFEHIALSAVFETLAQAQNVYDSCIAKAKATAAIPPADRHLLDGSLVTAGELRFFTICAVQQIPT